MARFDGHTVVITGAASGIGEATARGVVADGGNVVIADLQEDKGQALAEELGSAAVFQRCNVCEEADIEAALECIPPAVERLRAHGGG